MRTESDWLADRFEEHRGRLRAMAQRILGSANDAEDAVQETWIRYSRTDTADVENLGGRLTTVLSRDCLNMLQARRSRPPPAADPELPEPVAPPGELDPQREALLGDSIGLALQVVLDALTPAERVAFVLHDVFGVPFEQIAPIVERSAPATRQLASRARARVQHRDASGAVDPRRQSALVDAFLAAARDGDFAGLLAVLDPDVVLRADEHAAELGAARETRGAEPVAAFSGYARGARPALLDGVAAAVWMPGGRLRVVWAFATDGERITAIDLIADPERLRGLELVVPEDGPTWE